MPVGLVLPMLCKLLGKARQRFALKLSHARQHLALGMRCLQRQLEIMQQAAEQTAIEKCQSRARILLPESLGLAGNVVWQAFGRDVEAEQLRGCRLAAPGRQLYAAAESL